MGGLTRQWVEDLAVALTDSNTDGAWELSGGGFAVPRPLESSGALHAFAREEARAALKFKLEAR